jgi:hypothetical protein
MPSTQSRVGPNPINELDEDLLLSQSKGVSPAYTLQNTSNVCKQQPGAGLLDLSSLGIEENFEDLIKKFTTIYDDDGQKFLVAEQVESLSKATARTTHGKKGTQNRISQGNNTTTTQEEAENDRKTAKTNEVVLGSNDLSTEGAGAKPGSDDGIHDKKPPKRQKRAIHCSICGGEGHNA